MGKTFEFIILILLLLILAKLYGESFLGMLKIIFGWIWNFIIWFVDLVGRVSPK